MELKHAAAMLKMARMPHTLVQEVEGMGRVTLQRGEATVPLAQSHSLFFQAASCVPLGDTGQMIGMLNALHVNSFHTLTNLVLHNARHV